MNLLIFPNQLYLDHPGLKLTPSRIVLIEDSLYFGDPHYPLKFHKQKLWLHRATMKRFEQSLQSLGYRTLYLDFDPHPGSLQRHIEQITDSMTSAPKKLLLTQPTDFILEKRLARFCDSAGVGCTFLPDPGFINQPHENQEYRAGKKRWFMADFYKFQRRRLDVLMEDDQPVGGKWSFDKENRKKIPKKMLGEIPPLLKLKRDEIDVQAQAYVEANFPDNPGSIERLYYPTSHAQAKKWLQHFLKHRFENFGIYEDAIAEGESWLWHSVLTPALNVGLLTPRQVLKQRWPLLIKIKSL